MVQGPLRQEPFFLIDRLMLDTSFLRFAFWEEEYNNTMKAPVNILIKRPKSNNPNQQYHQPGNASVAVGTMLSTPGVSQNGYQQPKIYIPHSAKGDAANRANRTVVLDGTCAFPVKVKRVPIIENKKDEFHNLMSRHRSLCWHPNIVTVHEVEDNDKYHQIALEKCPYNLKEYLQSNNMSEPETDPTHIFRGIVLALKHIEEKKMIHGNLDVTHVLIKHIVPDLPPIPMLCSIGSRPKREDQANPIPDREGLAELISHCVTSDKGKSTRDLDKNKEACDLIKLLLHPDKVVDYIEVYIHPLFWTWGKRLEFIGCMSDYLLWLQTYYPNTPLIQEINAIEIGNWKTKIDPGWKTAMIEAPKSAAYEDNTCSFLQLVRNSVHHMREKPFFEKHDRRWLVSHIRSQFPSLFMDVYNITKGKMNCGYDGILNRFYTTAVYD